MNSRLPTPFRGLRRRLAERAAESDIWDAVQLARDDGRPYTLDYAGHLVDDWIEVHGDRAGTDDHAIVTGIGSFRGRTIAIVGHQKGRDLKERAFRNFGMAQPQGYAKARRVFALADRLGFPVVTMIDTPGAYPGVEAEQGGQAAAIAQSMLAMTRLRVPTVACVIGEGGSGGALAIGVADRVLMLEHSIYSVISPEGCASILWRDVNQRRKAAAAFKPTARFSYELGVVDTVVAEPSGGAHKDHERAARLLGDAISAALDSIEAEPVELRRAARRAKFRRMGVWLEDGVVVGEKEHDHDPAAPAPAPAE
jgi:acetyl-CoA carboxylase carboxyl transferase subunit alpha